MNRKAFTLIELLVVVAIIGILAAVGVVAYNGYTKSAKIAVVKANHNTVKKYIVAEIGRTHCNIVNTYATQQKQKRTSQKVHCYSRWGTGTNDYEESIIDNPF